MSASHAFAKGRHRFIGGSRLGLGVADLLLLAAAALEVFADALLRHGDLGLLHVLLLQLHLPVALVLALELVVCHGHEPVGGDVAAHDAAAEVLVGLVLKVGEERSDLLLVLGRLPLVAGVGGVLDRDRLGDDVGLGGG